MICKKTTVGTSAAKAARAKEVEGGFTLIELLVVIIIIAVLATIAIPTFLGQRQKAHDAACKSLIRNAASAIETGYVDAASYVTSVVGMRVADLKKLEPSMTFVVLSAAATKPTAKASLKTVNYTGTATTYSIGARTDSGKQFGMVVNKGSTGTRGVTFYVGITPKKW